MLLYDVRGHSVLHFHRPVTAHKWTTLYTRGNALERVSLLVT